MSNFKDIETLGTLSLDELEQVVGGYCPNDAVIFTTDEDTLLSGDVLAPFGETSLDFASSSSI